MAAGLDATAYPVIDGEINKKFKIKIIETTIWWVRATHVSG